MLNALAFDISAEWCGRTIGNATDYCVHTFESQTELSVQAVENAIGCKQLRLHHIRE